MKLASPALVRPEWCLLTWIAHVGNFSHLKVNYLIVRHPNAFNDHNTNFIWPPSSSCFCQHKSVLQVREFSKSNANTLQLKITSKQTDSCTSCSQIVCRLACDASMLSQKCLVFVIPLKCLSWWKMEKCQSGFQWNVVLFVFHFISIALFTRKLYCCRGLCMFYRRQCKSQWKTNRQKMSAVVANQYIWLRNAVKHRLTKEM